MARVQDTRISRTFRGPEATSHSLGHRAQGIGHRAQGTLSSGEVGSMNFPSGFLNLL